MFQDLIFQKIWVQIIHINLVHERFLSYIKYLDSKIFNSQLTWFRSYCWSCCLRAWTEIPITKIFITAAKEKTFPIMCLLSQTQWIFTVCILLPAPCMLYPSFTWRVIYPHGVTVFACLITSCVDPCTFTLAAVRLATEMTHQSRAFSISFGISCKERPIQVLIQIVNYLTVCWVTNGT